MERSRQDISRAVEQATGAGLIRALRARKDARVFQKLGVVLVGVDLDSGGTHALMRALRLQLSATSRVVLLHVLPTWVSSRRAEQDRSRATRQLQSLVSRLGPANGGPEMDLLISRGLAAVEVVRHARAMSADLIVVGRRPAAPRPPLLPTVWQRVLRYSSLPTLVVAGAAYEAYRRPVVAVDLSDSCRATVDLALRMVGPGIGEVILAHAFSVPFETWLKQSDLDEHFRCTAMRKMQALVEDYRDVQVRLKPVLRRGPAEPTVIAQISNQAADLLVTGHSGRTGLSRLVQGSYAEWFARNAPCDVLVDAPVRFAFDAP